MACFTLNAVWFHQSNILRFLQESQVSPFKNNVFMSPGALKLLVIVITIGMYTFQVHALWFDAGMRVTNEQTSIWIQGFIAHGDNDLYWNFVFNGLKKLVAFCSAQGYLLYMMPRLLLIFLPLQLKCLGMDFEELLESDLAKHFSVEKVSEEFDKLRSTVQCANSWAGGILLSAYIIMLSFLANLPETLRSESEVKLTGLGHIFYSGLMGIFLIFGCDLPKRVIWFCYLFICAN